MKLQDISQITNAAIQGDPDFKISSIAASPREAEAGQLALVFANKFAKAYKLLKDSQAQAIVISKELDEDEEFQNFKKSKQGINYLIVDRPKFALKQLITRFEKPRYQVETGVHPSAVVDASAIVDPSARIGALVYIGPYSKVGANASIHPRASIAGNVSIGEDSEIHSGVVIEDYVVIGKRVIIHANAVIGADGYSYVTEEASNLEKMQRKDFNFNMGRQVQHKVNCAGNVVIEDDVEIGANTCIDRGNIGSTIVGEGSKIDNLCQIAHNVQIGKDCLIIAQTGIAGSAKIGDRVTMAGASGCGDGVEIGNDVAVGAFSAVNSNVDPFTPVLGAPAIAYGEFMKRQKALVRLPKQQEELRKLKSKVEELNRN